MTKLILDHTFEKLVEKIEHHGCNRNSQPVNIDSTSIDISDK